MSETQKSEAILPKASAFDIPSMTVSGPPIRSIREYPSPPPQFANLEIVGQKWRENYKEVFRRNTAILPQSFIFKARNAIVFKNGFIQSEEGIQVIEALPYGNATPIDLEVVETYGKPSVLLRKHGDSNYGHWLIELCTRIQYFKTLFPNDQWDVIVSYNPAELKQIRIDSLAWLGIDENRIKWADYRPRVFQELYFITSNSIHSHTHDAAALLNLRDCALQRSREISKGPRLFVARRSSLRRRILNEESVLDLCKKFGLNVIFPEEFNLDEQVSIFSHAEIIVGISGAALTNILFAPKNCNILALTPNQGFELFFWDIANIVGQKFSFLFGESTSPQDGSHSDFVIDTNILEQWLKTAG
ncbi:MAG: glycosyltransferase family 61 protein [Azonexus sp.]|nr:glycosyltransferase family 61 protein [Azonexus sp.]